MLPLINDFINLFYPRLCINCLKQLVKGEQYICLNCQHDLPLTRFHSDADNLVVQNFWGRVKVNQATSYLFFRKDSIVQRIIHTIKYKGEKELGTLMGKRFGRELKNTEFENIDIIIPVPLHQHKKRKRGFNQSEVIANGIAKILNKPCNSKILKRKVNTRTQTFKNRFERWENVDSVFLLNNNTKLKNKHFLLIDDVITTGATLEACAQELLKIEGAVVSIATLAYANN